ncbi:MAG: diguanylate cyclase [Acidobacteria bacterium]|nr:diguanylate cyclase [Acidobacteriota bacterium]
MIVLLKNFDGDEAFSTAERVRKGIEANDFSVIGKGMIMTTIGVSTYPEPCSKWEELAITADQTAMKAKKLGKNRVLRHTLLSASIRNYGYVFLRLDSMQDAPSALSPEGINSSSNL